METKRFSLYFYTNNELKNAIGTNNKEIALSFFKKLNNIIHKDTNDFIKNCFDKYNKLNKKYFFDTLNNIPYKNNKLICNITIKFIDDNIYNKHSLKVEYISKKQNKTLTLLLIESYIPSSNNDTITLKLSTMT